MYDVFFDINIMYNLFMSGKNHIVYNGLDILRCGLVYD